LKEKLIGYYSHLGWVLTEKM